MLVPMEWLKEFVDFTLTPEELSRRLTMIGLEVEAMEKIDEDTVLDVNVTPNRPDCLSILGIAREISAVLNVPLRFPECSISGDLRDCAVGVEIIDADLCRRYAGRDIEGVKIAGSPEWMKTRLEKCGMRPINNVVDITNYVLLEMGHPLHAFDMDELEGRRIRVARSGPERTIKTLDGSERSLPGDALLIWDSVRPVAVAGIMGGAETEVREATRNVFIESAYFLPSSVRRTSKALGLRTESSFRFERGTDIELLEKALDRAALLISRIAGGVISKKVDAYPGPFRPSRIEVRYARVNKIIGTDIPPGEVIDIVTRLGIEVRKKEASFTAMPPSYRTDIQREIDIIEEVARFYGYDRIPVTVPRTQMPTEAKDGRYRAISRIGNSMRASGFTEAINYSFMNYGMLDTLRIADDDVRRRTVVLKNPINADEPHLRTTLLPSLIRNLEYNVSMGSREVRLFEISRVFMDRGETLPEERHNLGAVFFREKTPSLWKEEVPDFYVVKGAVESMLAELRTGPCNFQSPTEPFLHPGKACDIFLSSERIGFLGALHPDVIEKLTLKISRPEVVVFEIDLDALVLSLPETPKYAPIPRYPHIDRDVALIVDEALPAAAVMERMREYPTELIEEISVFDFYKGKNIPEGKKSLAFSIRYRAKDRTLTDSEIEEVHSALVRYITERTEATVRGV